MLGRNNYGGVQLISDRRIEGWDELADLIKSCSDGKWIFRGEPTAKYQLVPKAGRVGSYAGAARKVPYKLDDEVTALELFKRQARPYLQHTPTSDIEWLAIAQHHGMSTRLLDWTESLLVAAFFATEKAGTKGDAVIYGIRDLRPISKDEEENPFYELKSIGLYRPPHITPPHPCSKRSLYCSARPNSSFLL